MGVPSYWRPVVQRGYLDLLVLPSQVCRRQNSLDAIAVLDEGFDLAAGGDRRLEGYRTPTLVPLRPATRVFVLGPRLPST